MNQISHVAIIMDGNGRWGIRYKGSRNLGHRAGLDTVEKIIKETIKQKITQKNDEIYLCLNATILYMKLTCK